ncbi:hypothetical protein ODS41_03070 [Pyrobaculum sp. 3827-6]|uniref:hypothetical protein n=1 Tax=Pyrobaculum sp. 3827-6 TaxID=2983604 RepID=UPI0021D9D909|nr:hypothetical protein [Pyrobaculum sp. 3827-6]MCU7786909.1 hypothetical protein [Pyrobaculum sp. 3827-6]
MSVIKELQRAVAVDLIRLVIAYYEKRFREGVSARKLAKLLFLAVYTTDEGARLLDLPRVRLPEDFVIYRRGPSIRIGFLLGGASEIGKHGVVKTGRKYYVKGVDQVLKEASASLNGRGLGDLADYVLKIVDKFGPLSERELERYTLDLLGLRDEVAKALVFNMSLEAYLEGLKRLRKVQESGEYVDEEELYPDLFK